jgi:HEPN domain-containing protein
MSNYFGISYDGMVFEGISEHGAHLVWPQPVVTLANFAKLTDETLVPATENAGGHCCFREDFFDPVSRIRRGRFYQWTGRSNHYRVSVPEGVAVSGMFLKDNEVNVNQRAYARLNPLAFNDDAHDLVILGTTTGYSVWTIIGNETISTGENLVTLRARQTFGALPEIYWAKVPVAHRHVVQEAIEKLADDFRRAVSESVIDRAREAATVVLSAYLQNKGVDAAKGKDLGDLVKLLVDDAGKHEQRILACAAEIPQRLHSRGKNAEKEKRDDLRPLRERDAELAVQCVGVMLCDLRWADWK